MLSTSKLTLTSGPVVVEKSTVTCLDTVPALALGKCTVVGRDYYSNIVPSTRENAQLFVGVVTNYYGNPPGARIGTRVIVSETVSGGYEILYQAPSTGTTLRAAVLYRHASGISSTVGSYTNVTVNNINLDEAKTAETLSCFQTSATAGDTISCVVSAINSDGGLPITDPSYSNALFATIKSSSGERVVGIITPGSGNFAINFVMQKIGTVSLTVSYRSNDGDKPIGTVSGITIIPDVISVLTSKIACLPAQNVMSESTCIIAALDKYGNKAGTNDQSGGFSLEANADIS